MEQIWLTKSRNYAEIITQEKAKIFQALHVVLFTNNYRQLYHQRRYPCRPVDRVPGDGT